MSSELSIPRLLTDSELARLSPTECAALNEQLDQKIVSVLQRIDENFAESTRKITDVLLPSVEEYGRSSKEIWDSVKLWKMFFEASAGIRLGADPVPEPPPLLQDENDEYRGDNDYEDEDADVTARLEVEQDTEMRLNDQEETVVVSSSSATPDTTVRHASVTPEGTPVAPTSSSSRAQSKAKASADVEAPSWADQASPFEQLRQDIEKVRVVDSSYASSATHYAPPALQSEGFKQPRTARPEQQQILHQTRLGDLSIDSPDIRRPELETSSFQYPIPPSFRPTAPTNSGQNQQKQDAKGKAREMQDYRNHIQNPSPFFHTSNGSQATSTQPTPSSLSSPSFDLSSIEPPSLLQAAASSRPSIGRRQSSGANRLLTQVLHKNLGTSGNAVRPTASTPARSRKSIRETKAAQAEAAGGNGFYPLDLPRNGWNGIADLSQTPLSSFDSPQKSTISRFGDDDDNDWGRSGSPRRTGARAGSRLLASSSTSSLRSHQAEGEASLSFADQLQSFHPPPFSAMKTRLAKTPAKEAARLITRDVLQLAALRNGGDIEDAGRESPVFEPPSVVKNWATRGYTTTAAMVDSPRSGAGSEEEEDIVGKQLVQEVDREEDRDNKEEDSFEAEFDIAPPPPQPNFRHLADDDDDDELSASIGKRIVDDDDDLVEGGQAVEGDDWDDSYDGQEEGESVDDPVIAQDGFAEIEVPLREEQGEGNSFDSDASRSFGGDEETLFGAKAPGGARPSAASAAGVGAGYGMQDDDSFEGRDGGRDRQSAGFRLNGPDDMVTLHGGKLLESQPFEASPLAGRDARYGL